MSRSSTEIQADLTEAYAARIIALKAQSYSLDTGQGKQTVQRADLTAINKTIDALQQELAQAQANESGDSGIISGVFARR